MEVIAAVILMIFPLPIAVICFKKYMRTFDDVWEMNQSKREDMIQVYKGYALPIGLCLSMAWFGLILATIGVLEWLR